MVQVASLRGIFRAEVEPGAGQHLLAAAVLPQELELGDALGLMGLASDKEELAEFGRQRPRRLVLAGGARHQSAESPVESVRSVGTAGRADPLESSCKDGRFDVTGMIEWEGVSSGQPGIGKGFPAKKVLPLGPVSDFISGVEDN